jgi:signal transduction histidine kinase
MGAAVSSLFQRPPWVVAITITIAVIFWGVSLHSIAGQSGGPFPGFFCTPDRIVGAFTPRDFTGWRSGLRPWDRVVQVNGQHWREIPRLVREAGIGGSLVYTVERGDQRFQVTVPTMEFTPDILLRFIPAWLVFAVLALSIGIFVYTRNPSGQLNRYLLLYMLSWASVMGPAWEYSFGQYKWSVYLYWPMTASTCVAGWIFFWSFPADRERKEFLARWPLIPGFIGLGVAASLFGPVLFLLASRLDLAGWWNLYTLSATWGFFLVFAGGSVFNKTFPLFRIALRRGTPPLIRHQALVLLCGIVIGLGGFILFVWAPWAIHFPMVANPQWGALIAALYPLAIGYAVLRYQLFDIRIVIRKGLVYSLLTATLTVVFLLVSLSTGFLFQTLVGQQSLLVAIPPALLVAVLFQPARGRIQTLVDRAFFRREYEMRQALTAFSRELSTLRDQNDVVRLVLHTVTETLGADSAELWLPDDGRYRPTRGEPIEFLAADGELAARLARGRRPVLRLPGEQSAQAQDLRRAGAALAVPLLVSEKLSGFLTLGEKRSGNLYTQDDLDLLATLAQSAALALENARLHEERLAILRQQLAQVIAAQEEERQRIARELHDGVGPSLASLNIRLRTARKLLEHGHLPPEEIDELAELAQCNIQDIHRLIHDLRPTIVDELGLLAALRAYVSRYQEEHDLEVALVLPDGDGRLSAVLETALFRVIQEALSNVARHAKARCVEIVLMWDDQHMSVQVTDDGQGFDLEAALAQARGGGHLGLWNMRERVKQLGGQFAMHSVPGGGTTVQFKVPIKVETEAWTKSAS